MWTDMPLSFLSETSAKTLRARQVTFEDGSAAAVKEHWGFIEVSAATNSGIESLMPLAFSLLAAPEKIGRTGEVRLPTSVPAVRQTFGATLQFLLTDLFFLLLLLQFASCHMMWQLCASCSAPHVVEFLLLALRRRNIVVQFAPLGQIIHATTLALVGKDERSKKRNSWCSCESVR